MDLSMWMISNLKVVSFKKERNGLKRKREKKLSYEYLNTQETGLKITDNRFYRAIHPNCELMTVNVRFLSIMLYHVETI